MKRKFVSNICSPEQVEDTLGIFDREGYDLIGMTAAVAGSGYGQSIVVILAFKLRSK